MRPSAEISDLLRIVVNQQHFINERLKFSDPNQARKKKNTKNTIHVKPCCDIEIDKEYPKCCLLC